MSTTGTVWYLATCDTCKRIMKSLSLPDSFKLREIKSEAVTAEELDHLAGITGSYESLFNRRSRKFAAVKAEGRALDEAAYRELILGEYTFLKRPVFLIGSKVFAGNSAKTVEDIRQELA